MLTGAATNERGMNRKGLLVVVSGPSGVGKTSITHALVAAFRGAVFSVSVTTRARTHKDREGADYFFVDDAQFDEMIAAGAFLEWANVFGKRYGTPRAWVERRLADGHVVVLEIDVHGAEQVRAACPDMLGIFVLPPSEGDLLGRLRARRREDEDAIQRRFAEARREMARARAGGTYDAFVVNDVLERAVEEATAIVRVRLQSPTLNG